MDRIEPGPEVNEPGIEHEGAELRQGGTWRIERRSRSDSSGESDPGGKDASHRLSLLPYGLRLILALSICIVIGLAGILPDLDHLIPYFQDTAHRWAHIMDVLSIAIISGGIAGVAIALDIRRIHRSRLNGRE